MTQKEQKQASPDYLHNLASHERSLVKALARSIRNELADFLRDFIRLELRDLRREVGIEKQAPLDSAQACERLNCSRRKLDQLVAEGKLRPLRLGRKRLFPAAQLDALLRECAR